MDTSKDTPTVEQSLEVLSETIGKAAEDLETVRARLDQERFEIASRNTSVNRGVIRHAALVVDHLRQAAVDQAKSVEAKARADWERAQQALRTAEEQLAKL